MSRGSINIPVVSKFDPTGLKQAQGALKGFVAPAWWPDDQTRQ